MNYITVVAKTFEEALSSVKSQYGNQIRIHSRKDVTKRGGFLFLKKRHSVELTCYLAPQKEEKVEEKRPEERESELIEEISPQEVLLGHATQLLQKNNFSELFIEKIELLLQNVFNENRDHRFSVEEFELIVIDKIVSLLTINHKVQLNPPRICVLVGPTGVGKTTTVAKLAALYGLQEDPEFKRNVHMITIDSFRIGAFEQLQAFGDSLGIAVERVSDENEFFQALDRATEADFILIDTIGRSPKDADLELKSKTLLSVVEKEEASFYLVINSSMKEEDLHLAYDNYANVPIEGVIITKVDESATIGNVLSLCYEKELPILYITDGQRVPKDIHKASAATILTNLTNFSLDFETLWMNQMGPVSTNR